MFFNMSYYFGISMILVIVLVVFIFVWRKISENEVYIKVLEKKITNLKKENNNLCQFVDAHGAENISMKLADDIMKDVFGGQMCSDEKCEVKPVDNEEEDEICIQEVCEEEPDTTEISEVDESNNIKTGGYTKTALLKIGVEKLRDICKDMGLSTTGSKNVLIDRILYK